MAEATGERTDDWFYFDPIYFLPLWIGIWRWAAYLILKVIPSLLYKPIPISETLRAGEVEVNTSAMTMIIPVYMPEPGFEECIQSWIDNRPKTIVVVVDTNSYQQVKHVAARDGRERLDHQLPVRLSARGLCNAVHVYSSRDAARIQERTAPGFFGIRKISCLHIQTQDKKK